jgi:hypothetical protein
VLRSLRDDIELVLAPAQVTLAGNAARRRVIDCPDPEPGAPAWSAALSVLERALDDDAVRGARLNVILSNRFVRYAVVPWQDGVHGAAEDAAYVRLHFVETYGSAAGNWDLCASAAPAGHPRLASAIDADLLAALRGICATRDVALRAVWPQLCFTFNRYRKRVDAASGWLVLAESGCLCIALFDAARWLTVSVARLPARWQHALPELLERAACLANPAGAANQVYWWAEEGEPPPPHACFQFHQLHGGAT